MLNRIRTALYWSLPALIALVLYWPGLTAWFQKDDLAWLNLHSLVESDGLTHALFHPYAQGTVRTLSERVMFIGLYYVFGADALPFRILGFLTHAANLVLLCIVCRKLTGSRAAGFLAAVSYTINSALAVPLSWTCIYYELLCTFCFLLNLWLLMRYSETGRTRYFAWQWVVFLLGFGVLELNVVYPAIALLYALCCARKLVLRVLPMFVASALYTAAKFSIAPPVTTGPYKMYVDGSLFKTLWIYWAWALGPARLWLLGIPPSFLRSAATAVLMAGLLTFLCWKLRSREWTVLLFPGWFLLVLGPLLPLRDHISDYYLTIPVAGLAMWGGWAIASAWRSSLPMKALAVISLMVYAGVSIPVALAITRSFHDRSVRIQSLVEGVVELHENKPGRAIVLKNADAEMIRSALYHNPFRIYGMGQTYFVPEDAAAFRSDPLFSVLGSWYLEPAKLRQMIDDRKAAVYDVQNEKVTDVTAGYR